MESSNTPRSTLVPFIGKGKWQKHVDYNGTQHQQNIALDGMKTERARQRTRRPIRAHAVEEVHKIDATD